jgi:hypothetical protein
MAPHHTRPPHSDVFTGRIMEGHRHVNHSLHLGQSSSSAYHWYGFPPGLTLLLMSHESSHADVSVQLCLWRAHVMCTRPQVPPKQR